MYLFKLKAFAVTASFRIPESHTFQQTLPLPPITTLIVSGNLQRYKAFSHLRDVLNH